MFEIDESESENMAIFSVLGLGLHNYARIVKWFSFCLQYSHQILVPDHDLTQNCNILTISFSLLQKFLSLCLVERVR